MSTPNGGEIWVVAASHAINWTRNGSIATVKLEYSIDSGFTYPTTISPSVDASLGTYSWTIPDNISNLVRAKITDTSDSTVYDESNSDFSIKGVLTLIAPNGAEEWVVGTGENITWTRVGSILNVKLEYSTNSGGTYPNTIIASTGAPAGSYSWPIPDVLSTILRVRVSDVLDASVNDVSNANFMIKGDLELNTPNGGEIWYVGESRSITWTRIGSIPAVKLEYSTDSGSSYPNTIISSTDASLGIYSWTIPDAITENLRVRVIDTANTTVFDGSNGDFTVKGVLTLNTPNGGEIWVVGSSSNIIWTPTGTIANVRLEYSTDNGSTYANVIIASTGGMAGSYSWTVADSIGTNLKVRVTDVLDASVSDVSNNAFTVKGSLVVTIPNGGEIWGVATPQTITWTRNGSIATVLIDYSTNGGSTYPNTIAATADASTQSYGWTIPDDISSQVKVRITDNSDASVSDASDTNFKIVGILDLTTPDGGEMWEVNTNNNIMWTVVGSITNVRLDYSINSGVSYPTNITTSSPAGVLSFTWTIPDAPVQTIRVRIADASDITVFDASTADFTIMAQFDITVPNGGQVWEVGTSHDITWATIGSVTTVVLDYSTDGGVTFPTNITASTANTGSFPWTIPDSISSQARVRVSDYNNANAFGISTANFKIRGSVLLTAPNGGESWMVTDSENITWGIVGSIANVKLEFSINSGVTYSNTIISSVDATLGTYAWTIPNNICQTARVKITDTTDSLVYDTADNDFTIRGDLLVGAPNGGEEWAVSTVHNVTWSRTGSVQNVKIDYSANAGSTFPYVIVASTDGSMGSYPWVIPDTISSQVRVRVSDVDNSAVYDISDANAKIMGIITVMTPNGSEVWAVTDSHAITWAITGAISNVSLDYSTDSGAIYANITPSVNAALGTYNWSIPDNISDQVRGRVSNVSDATVNDESDNDFKIIGQLLIGAPNGGEVWPVGTSQSVTWSPIGTINNVILQLSTNGGVSYPIQIVASTPAAAGSYNWTVPDQISQTCRVKVADVDDPSLVFVASAGNFKIRGDLTMTVPNGSEVWLINSSHDIEWTRFGQIANARLEYSKDSGTTFSSLIVGSVDASLQRYNWVIPDNPGILIRVRISDAADSTVYDISDANFIIRGGFEVVEPNGGEIWAIGSDHDITWNSFGTIPNVRLTYSKDNSAHWTIIVGTIPNTDMYAWTIPDAISAQCLIRVADVVDADAYDVSDTVFNIHGSLDLTAPNGGEAWQVGSGNDITWLRTGSIVNVKLDYSTDSGATYPNSIVASTTAATLTYEWTLPDNLSDTVKVIISDAADATVFDVSAGVFKIMGGFEVTAPNGSESYMVNSTQTVTWNTLGTVANARLDYSVNQGGTWTIIIASTVNTNSYIWTVPDAISDLCRVRVMDTADSSSFDSSNNNFSIKGNLILTAPNGGEQWAVGSNQLITWSRVGSISTVMLEYSDNNGTIFVPITISALNTGAYSWAIPDAITTQALVRITNIADLTVTDTSDAVFKIQGSFTVTAPNGGEAWLVGSAQNITWNWNGTVPFVKVEFSINSGSTYSLIADNIANIGSYAWTIPDSLSGNCRVRVSDSTDEDANDICNGNFRIRCKFTIANPNGTEQWRVGQSRNINWSNVGTASSVTLQYSRDGFGGDIQSIADNIANVGTYAWTIPDSISKTVKVRVSDPTDPGAVDDSNADFNITGDFTVTSPNGTEIWDVNSSHDIIWTWQGTMPQVRIEYSVDGGASYPNIITATDNDGNYTWTVPDAITPQMRVRVSDLADPTAEDTSDNNAKIKAQFLLTAPSGGEVFIVNDTTDIEWSSVGTVSNVSLLYSTNGFTTATTILTPVNNDGSYTWSVPDAISTSVTVRVMSSTDSDAYDTSDVDFEIKGDLEIISPNGGENWAINQASNITWNTTGTITNVQILYSVNSGVSYPYTIANNTVNTSSYAWTVPDTATPSGRLMVINIADVTVYDESDGNFRIQGYFEVTSPIGGESWIVDETHNITWDWGGTLALAHVSYSTDSGTTYPNVINAAAANGAGTGGSHSFAWTIPDDLSQTARVKIEDPNDATVFDTSDADFKIRGDLTLITPNGAERWITREDRQITWNTVGSISNVRLEYSINHSVNSKR